MTEHQSKTQLGIAAAKAGQNGQAREWFIAALQENDQDITAWLWLSQVVETDEDRLECIEQVLRLNPEHPLALKAQVVLRARLAASAPVLAEAAPSVENAPLVEETKAPLVENAFKPEVTERDNSVEHHPSMPDQESAPAFIPPQPVSTAVPPLTENITLSGKRKKEQGPRVRHVGPFTILPPELADQPEYQQETVIVLSPLAIAFLIILGLLLLVMVVLAGSLLIFAPQTFWQNLTDFFGGLWGIIRGRS